MSKRLAALVATILAAFFGVGDARAQSAAPELTVHFIDVAQGDATLVTCPNGATILIDAGNKPPKAAIRTRVVDYVRNHIVPAGGDIDYLILSHPDEDHYNLLRPVSSGVPIGRTYYVGVRGHYADKAVFDWISTVAPSNVHLTESYFDPESTPNPDIDCGAAKVWILAAGVQAPDDDKNTKSIVVMIRLGDFEAVITGDATFATENKILSRYSAAFLDVDVLQVGHHGALVTSTSPTWADTLKPNVAIFSAGSVNTFGHPRAEVVARLTPYTDPAPPHPFRDAVHDSGRRYTFTTHPAVRENVYATATNGTIVVKTSGSGFSLLINQ